MSLARSLAARGVSPTSPPAQRAAEVVRVLPLRMAVGGAEDPAGALARGWINGPAEAAALIGTVTGWAEDTGAAFGTRWPLFVHDTVVVAPALPVALGLAGAESQGPDAVYRIDAGIVWREAAGFEDGLLEFSGRPVGGTPDCDLVWFGPGERYLVRGGELEISDLFADLRLPATTSQLERLLVRGLRLAPRILHGLAGASSGGSPRLTVRRHRALLPGGCPAPADLVGARADVSEAHARGDRVEVRLESGGRAVFGLEPAADGWRLELVAGDYPLLSLAVGDQGDDLVYQVTLGPTLDPLRPGLRGRLAFDLTSDLVMLAR